jgi:uncharacterized sulfatase
MRYSFIFCALLATVGCHSSKQPRASAAQPAPRPNILWISAEDISPDLGCYGDPDAHTPNLDAFAASGVRFNNAFSTAPVCSPSRSSIITGMYASSIGTMHHRSVGVPPRYVKCFPEYLRAAGYFCTNNAKTDYNFPTPITAWDECNQKAHWRHRKEGQPFFAVFNLNVSHESRLRMNDKEIERELVDVKKEDRHDPAKVTLPVYLPDTPVVRKDWARYNDMITELDIQVAQILKQLDDDGLSKNTIVFFWGDHGRCFPRGKRWLWDSGIKVPLLVRWPGWIEPGTVRNDLVSLFDLGPTLLNLAGAEIPTYMQGQIILGPHTAPPRQYIYCCRDRMDETPDTIRCVRDKQFKYIRNFHPELPYAQIIKYQEKIPTFQEWRRLDREGKLVYPQNLFMAKTKPPEELYDITQDPDEIHNLANDPDFGEQLVRMRKALDDWMKKTNDLGLVPEADLQARMRPNGVTPVTEKPTIHVSKDSGDSHTVTIDCPTPGASIAYTTEESAKPHWKLYTGPLKFDSGVRLRAMACRTGFENSGETSQHVGIEPVIGKKAATQTAGLQ